EERLRRARARASAAVRRSRLRRRAGRSRGGGSGAQVLGAARRRAEDRLVLRPECQSGAPRALYRLEDPGARCVLVCRRLGGRGAAPWRGSGALRRRLGGGARARTAQRRAQQCRARVLHADAFDALKSLGERGERFEVVILDPPAFIKRKKDIPKGQAAYRKLN